MVKGVRRSSARRARPNREFNPRKRRNIYMYYVSTVVQRAIVAYTDSEKYHHSSQKNSKNRE